MEAEVKRRRIARDAIGWDSKAEEFMAFEKKALFATGFIQGLEFALNVIKSTPQLLENTKADIKAIETSLKSKGRK